MEAYQKKYYRDMLKNNRGMLILRDNRLVAIITYLISDEDDENYLFLRKPWTMICDDAKGNTVYIDQLLTKESTSKYIHREFINVLKKLKQEFPNVVRAKWLRAPIHIRKKGVHHVKTKFLVYCKDIK